MGEAAPPRSHGIAASLFFGECVQRCAGRRLIILAEDYKEMSQKRIELLKYHRKRSDQLTILVLGIPQLCRSWNLWVSCSFSRWMSDELAHVASRTVLKLLELVLFPAMVLMQYGLDSQRLSLVAACAAWWKLKKSPISTRTLKHLTVFSDL